MKTKLQETELQALIPSEHVQYMYALLCTYMYIQVFNEWDLYPRHTVFQAVALYLAVLVFPSTLSELG